MHNYTLRFNTFNRTKFLVFFTKVQQSKLSKTRIGKKNPDLVFIYEVGSSFIHLISGCYFFCKFFKGPLIKLENLIFGRPWIRTILQVGRFSTHQNLQVKDFLEFSCFLETKIFLLNVYPSAWNSKT